MGRAATFEKPDLGGVLQRADSDWNWNGDKAISDSAVKWYEAFLKVVYNNPGGRSYIVTTEADQLWHTHMTFTARYRQYCISILGFFLDHTPPLDTYVASPDDVTAAQTAYSTVLSPADVGTISPDLIKPCW
jgi:hypothetical protein